MRIKKHLIIYRKSKIFGRLTGINGVFPPFSFPLLSRSKARFPLDTATVREDIAVTYASGNVDVSLLSMLDDVSYFLIQ